MPITIIFVLLVEFALIALTMLLMAQPEIIFRSKSVRLQSFLHWGAMLLLCLTFCWSVVVGIVLTMNGLDFAG